MIKRFMLFVFVLLLLADAPVNAQKTKVKTLSAKKFERKMQRPNVMVLDVRTDEEFGLGHIENAVQMDVKDSSFVKKINTLDKQKTYLVYCRSGVRSEKALRLLNNAGFGKTYHLKGGYLNWQASKKKE